MGIPNLPSLDLHPRFCALLCWDDREGKGCKTSDNSGGGGGGGGGESAGNEAEMWPGNEAKY